MDNPGPSILAFMILLIFSAFFSASETSLSSINRVRMKTCAEDGDKKARKVLDLADDYDRTLSTILIGNNVVNLASASISTVLCTTLMGANGAVVATGVTTVLVLIFGEILPKSLAKERPEKFSLMFAPFLSFIKTVLTPVAWVFVQIKRLLTGLRSNELNVQPSVTEEELKVIIDTVEEEGVLDRQETDIIQSAIDFDNITVQDILVPRVDIGAASLDDPPEEILKLCLQGGHSRIPVYDGSIDHIVGVLHARDLLACLSRGETIDPRKLRRDVLFVYRTKRINELLAELRREKQHMAIVTDEHGGTLGLVTMEDILEELVGEIWDESDMAEQDIQPQGDNIWQVAGDAKMEDLFEAMDYEDKDFEDDYSTVSGWALDMFQHIPEEGESFTWKRLHVRVEKMDDQRIEWLRVTLMNEDPTGEKSDS